MSTSASRKAAKSESSKTRYVKQFLDGVIGNNFDEAYDFMKKEGSKLGLKVVKELEEPVKVTSNGPVPKKTE